MSLHRFLGAWVLEAPPAGVEAVVCCVTGHGPTLRFETSWTDAEGAVREAIVDAIPDGVSRVREDGLAVSCSEAAGGVLHTVLSRDGAVLLREHRSVSGDGSRCVVEEVEAGGQRSVNRFRRARVKQVLVYRRDLKMRKGKIAAQCAHASTRVFLARDVGGPGHLVVPLRGPMAVWMRHGSAKIVLSVETEVDLLRVHQEAVDRGLPTSLITDAGRTEFGGVPTKTAVAVGPALVEEVDAITGPEGLVATKLA